MCISDVLTTVAVAQRKKLTLQCTLLLEPALAEGLLKNSIRASAKPLV
jgi:hypothetical protein